MRRRHTAANLNMDICCKCGMTGLKQVEQPRRACRPRISKRRAKILHARKELNASQLFQSIFGAGQFVPYTETHSGDGGYDWTASGYRWVNRGNS